MYSTKVLDERDFVEYQRLIKPSHIDQEFPLPIAPHGGTIIPSRFKLADGKPNNQHMTSYAK
jgi:hypothetical protein